MINYEYTLQQRLQIVCTFADSIFAILVYTCEISRCVQLNLKGQTT